ncbi:uncharacterized protein [Pleurodeles waltl]|uniref:uncharacterized protein n=1 Tax=Pleurodeles waltl TaxID=8319 RepID=UPI003709B09A
MENVKDRVYNQLKRMEEITKKKQKALWQSSRATAAICLAGGTAVKVCSLGRSSARRRQHWFFYVQRPSPPCWLPPAGASTVQGYGAPVGQGCHQGPGQHPVADTPLGRYHQPTRHRAPGACTEGQEEGHCTVGPAGGLGRRQPPALMLMTLLIPPHQPVKPTQVVRFRSRWSRGRCSCRDWRCYSCPKTTTTNKAGDSDPSATECSPEWGTFRENTSVW